MIWEVFNIYIPPCPHTLIYILFIFSWRSEANDLAVEICRVVTSGKEVLVVDGAYHGHTTSLLGLSTYKMGQQKTPQGRIKPNPNAWVVSVKEQH